MAGPVERCTAKIHGVKLDGTNAQCCSDTSAAEAGGGGGGGDLIDWTGMIEKQTYGAAFLQSLPRYAGIHSSEVTSHDRLAFEFTGLPLPDGPHPPPKITAGAAWHMANARKARQVAGGTLCHPPSPSSYPVPLSPAESPVLRKLKFSLICFLEISLRTKAKDLISHTGRVLASGRGLYSWVYTFLFSLEKM